MTSQLNASGLHHCGGMGEIVKDLCGDSESEFTERYGLEIYVRFSLTN